MERFWSKVGVAAPEACWEWRAGRLKAGYGFFKVARPRGNVTAHRMAWTLTFGAIPDGLLVCHHCDNPPCCNPAHLFLGTDADNARDKIAKGRQVRGERVGTSKLTVTEVASIRLAASEGRTTQTKIAALFGVSGAQLSRIVSHTRWSVL